MQKRMFSGKIKGSAIAAGVFLLLLVLFCVSREYSFGQAYQSVSVDGTVVGYVPQDLDVSVAFCEARRALAAEKDEKLCMDYVWSADTEKKPFVRLQGEEAFQETLKSVLQEKIISDKEQVYTVAIGDYRGNFKTLEDVESFLDQVKDHTEGAEAYQTTVRTENTHMSGLLRAQLSATAAGENAIDGTDEAESFLSAGSMSVSEKVLAEETAGSDFDVTQTYQTGVLDMKFVEQVEVYENYVAQGNLSDIAKAVEEVTKEKESNKIYVVESGDCLSVIALDNNTTVASIMALNGMESADAIIRDGQELIIAVPEPDLKVRVTKGEVYEEDYEEEPIIIENNSWYTNQEVVRQEGTTGHRERNDVVVYENGVETNRELLAERVMVPSTAAVIEQGTVIPPTYIKPIAGGHFTSGFGRRWGRMHKGVDWGCPVGTTVYASCGGTVIQASYNGGYGNNVVISHPDGRMTRYAHNSKLLVKVGQKVEQGEPIALSGSTGRSTGPHVHFEIYINGAAVNPLKYISN